MVRISSYSIFTGIFFAFLGFLQTGIGGSASVRLEGHPIFIFNGIPKSQGWGEDLVYKASPSTMDTRTMGALGGMPLVDIWNAHGGIAIFNTTTYQEPLTVKMSYARNGVTIKAEGGSNIEIFKHTGDYFEAVREFALRMKKKGLSVQPAPDWAFNANWETYGFKEDYDLDTIKGMLPILKKLGIKTVTIDSGWYGEHRGDEIEFHTGDFIVNPDVVEGEQDLIELIKFLHSEGFRVRVWWSPGVAEEDTELWRQHPDWFSKKVISSTGDTEDVFIDPGNPLVRSWNSALIKRFLSYGVDGFKQDDIYNYISSRPQDQRDYANLINSNLVIAQSIKEDFAINTCNCGLAQNFYLLPGQNQIITSDPLGSRQFRHRAKYLHALNVNGAAILGDHVELTRGDIEPEDMDEPGFYNTVDFISIVPLGMVLQTKFRKYPGPLYEKWFKIYNDYKFYNMKWVNIPLKHNQLETYLMRDQNTLYFSFFTENEDEIFRGEVNLTHLIPGIEYQVYDIENDALLGGFTAESERYSLNLTFKHGLAIRVSPLSH